MVGRALLFSLLCAICSAQEQESRKVALAQGEVRGYRGADGDYFAFYGIPYATAPTGRDKYKAPLPAPEWTETFEAVDKKVICPQKTSATNYIQDDQCLITNIFVPVTEEINLPVVVFIHGGGYLLGYGNLLKPKEMVAQGNFIGVNFNYRLGVHGFLCLGTENVPGNAGMKDMVALLRWIKVNIANFGGNPDDVTVTGSSSGSGAAHLLSLSKATRNLFNKVILESGSAVASWGVDVDPLASATHYASLYNFTSDNVYKLEEFYVTKSIEELVVAQTLFLPDSSLAFSPCIERDIDSEVFLNDNPINILNTGEEYLKRPCLTGFTEKDGRVRLSMITNLNKALNENFEEFLPRDLQFANNEEKKYVANKVKEFYFDTKNISTEAVENFVDFQTDAMFSFPMVRSVSLQAQAGNDALFLYCYSFFDETCPQRKVESFPKDVIGAGHTAQTYAIYGLGAQSPEFSTECKEMIALLRRLWINFIRTGHPVPENSNLIEGGWAPAGVHSSPYMSLNIPYKLEPGTPWQERMKLWSDIYEKHYRYPVPPPTPPPRDF